MANVVVWIVILFTASYVSQVDAIDDTTIKDSDVSCTADNSDVTLNLAGLAPRPTKVIINNYIKDTANCVRVIPEAPVNPADPDTKTVTIDFTKCGITKQDTVATFTLSIVRDAKYLSKGDGLVSITCNVKTDTIKATVTVNRVVDLTKIHGIPETATAISMTFETAVVGEAASPISSPVDLGDRIALKLTATGGVSFDVVKCTVESTADDVGSTVIGPHDITTGWCSANTNLFSNFGNNNVADKTSTTTFKAFRLVGQGLASALTFKCDLTWCPGDASGACGHPDNVGCAKRRRRRSLDDAVDRSGNERTLSFKLYVNLPGVSTSGTTAMAGSDYIVKLAVLLFCGLRYIMY